VFTLDVCALQILFSDHKDVCSVAAIQQKCVIIAVRDYEQMLLASHPQLAASASAFLFYRSKYDHVNHRIIDIEVRTLLVLVCSI
jgi:hypothetical protein